MSFHRFLRRGTAAGAASCALLLGGCAVTEAITDAGRIDYRAVGEPAVATLEVPPDLVTPRRDDRFTIPDRRGAETTYSAYARDRGSPTQASLARATVPTGVKLERAGNQRWLVVDQPPERVWPIVRQFWLDSGFTLSVEMPEIGILETGWAENRPRMPQGVVRRLLSSVVESISSTGERDKFRTRLEPRGDRTEIFISHRGMSENLIGQMKDQAIWQPRPNDPELEAEFLQRLMQRFIGEQPQVLVASAAPTTAVIPDRASLIDDAGVQALRFDEPFERAWRQVGLALDRVGFTVEDRDRSKGVFYVRYVDPRRDDARAGGLLARVFGSGENRDLLGKRYRIVVDSEQSVTRVGVRQADGSVPQTEDDRRVAQRIVALLHEQLR